METHARTRARRNANHNNKPLSKSLSMCLGKQTCQVSPCHLQVSSLRLLPLGHLECPSQGATNPWAKFNMGEPLPPGDIAI